MIWPFKSQFECKQRMKQSISYCISWSFEGGWLCVWMRFCSYACARMCVCKREKERGKENFILPFRVSCFNSLQKIYSSGDSTFQSCWTSAIFDPHEWDTDLWKQSYSSSRSFSSSSSFFFFFFFCTLSPLTVQMDSVYPMVTFSLLYSTYFLNWACVTNASCSIILSYSLWKA